MNRLPNDLQEHIWGFAMQMAKQDVIDAIKKRKRDTYYTMKKGKIYFYQLWRGKDPGYIYSSITPAELDRIHRRRCDCVCCRR